MKSPSPKHQKNPWSPCRPGMIQQVACSNQNGSDRRHFLQRVGGIGAAAIIVAGASFSFGWLGARPETPNSRRSKKLPTATVGTISCAQVQGYLAAFAADKIQDTGLREQISHHLKSCNGCRKSYMAILKSRGGCGIKRRVPK